MIYEGAHNLEHFLFDYTIGSVAVTCPEDFLFNARANFCFKIYGEKMTRIQANRYCQNIGSGARLAILDTPDKRHFVKEHLQAFADDDENNKNINYICCSASTGQF